MNNFYVKYKSPIAVILLLILLGGIYALTDIFNRVYFPNITFPKIKIIADNGEQPVDKMTVTVTVPLENAIKRVTGFKFSSKCNQQGKLRNIGIL